MIGTENSNMYEFERGETTERMYDDYLNGRIDHFSNDYEVKPEALKKIESDAALNPLLTGIVERLCKLRVYCTADDKELIRSEITKRYKERIGENCPRTIVEWTKGQKPSTKRRGRLNHYTICYALEMNLFETRDFFIKYFHTLPYNFKDTTDAIFYYGLKHNCEYQDIKSLLDYAEGLTSITNEAHDSTAEIQRQINDIDDDDEFKTFLSHHCYSDAQKFQRARDQIIKLVEKHKKDKMSYAEFHYTIMGFYYQGTPEHGKRSFAQEEFYDSLPTDQTFADIVEHGKAETYDTFRKTLIILLLYDMYVDYKDEPTNDQITERLDDIYAQSADILYSCGLVPLYEKNYFDAVILYCANSNHPLTTFTEICRGHYKSPKETGRNSFL